MLQRIVLYSLLTDFFMICLFLVLHMHITTHVTLSHLRSKRLPGAMMEKVLIPKLIAGIDQYSHH